MSLEQKEEEKANLERRLLELMKEYQDVQYMNDDIEKENRAKDVVIQRLESKYNILHEENVAELKQLELENNCFNDDLSHKINCESRNNCNIDSLYLRMNDMETSNNTLNNSIKDLSETIRENTFQHSQNMHNVNKEMNAYRHDSEETMKKQLIQFQQIYQEIAFESLLKEYKEILFKYALLKDEISLQKVGLLNLESRIKNQELYKENFRDEMKSVNNTSEKMKDLLASVKFTRKIIEDIQRNIIKHNDNLLSQQNKLLKEQYEFPPTVNDIISELSFSSSKLSSINLLYQTWLFRFKYVEKLLNYIEPRSSNEKYGKYNMDMFQLNFESNIKLSNNEKDFTIKDALWNFSDVIKVIKNDQNISDMFLTITSRNNIQSNLIDVAYSFAENSDPPNTSRHACMWIFLEILKCISSSNLYEKSPDSKFTQNFIVSSNIKAIQSTLFDKENNQLINDLNLHSNDIALLKSSDLISKLEILKIEYEFRENRDNNLDEDEEEVIISPQFKYSFLSPINSSSSFFSKVNSPKKLISKDNDVTYSSKRETLYLKNLLIDDILDKKGDIISILRSPELVSNNIKYFDEISLSYTWFQKLPSLKRYPPPNTEFTSFDTIKSIDLTDPENTSSINNIRHSAPPVATSTNTLPYLNVSSYYSNSRSVQSNTFTLNSSKSKKRVDPLASNATKLLSAKGLIYNLQDRSHKISKK